MSSAWTRKARSKRRVLRATAIRDRSNRMNIFRAGSTSKGVFRRPPATCAALSMDAFAQNYPTKTLRYIVPYPPGGAADILARAVGAKLTEAWGQSVVVENRAGAGTNLGSEIAAKAPPDGYVLFMPTIANAINPTLYGKLSYDPVKDFSYVTNIAKVPGIVVVHPSVPVKNAKELIALA